MNKNRDAEGEGSTDWYFRRGITEGQRTDSQVIRRDGKDSKINTEVDGQIIWVRRGQAGSIKRDIPKAPWFNISAFFSLPQEKILIRWPWSKFKCSCEWFSPRPTNNLESALIHGILYRAVSQLLVKRDFSLRFFLSICFVSVKSFFTLTSL